MDIRPLTPAYAVSPQITPEDIPAIAAAGFTTIICNRPDGEIPASLHAEEMEKAARAAGLDFIIHPVTHPTIGPDTIARQRQVLDSAPGPVLAYCASGTRSSILWALGQVGEQSSEDILAAASRAGYDLSGLAPTLHSLSNKG